MFCFQSSPGSLLEFSVSSLSYPDEKVKSSVVYLLVQVCSKTTPNSLPLSLIQSMCRHISTNLATAKSHELTINMLGKRAFFLTHLFVFI